MEKHSQSRLSYLFAHLHLLSSDLFSSELSLLSASSLLCFSSVHIVGSLASKLPSIKDIVGESFIEDDADDQQKGDRNAMSDSKQTQTEIDTTFERPTETAKKHIHTRTHKQRYRHRRTHTHTRTRYTDRHHTHTHTHNQNTKRKTHTRAHTHRHRHTCTQRGRRIHKLNRPFYTPTLLHTNPFTHRRFCTDAFTHRHFYAQTLLHTKAFTPVFDTRPPFRAKGFRFDLSNRNFTSFLDTRPSFRAKGLRANLRNRNFTTRLDIKTYESEQSAANAMLSCKKYDFTLVFDD